MCRRCRTVNDGENIFLSIYAHPKFSFGGDVGVSSSDVDHGMGLTVEPEGLETS